jgi:hypothetical protein
VPEGEGLLAEQPAPPASERRHVGIVAGGDVLEVADDGNDFGSDAVACG